MQLIVAARGHF